MTRSPFINRTEFLLVQIHDGDGLRFEESTYLHENFDSPEDALSAVEQSYFAEDVQNIYRWEPGSTPENVTDDIAHAYLGVHNVYSWDAETLPEWVKQSNAWDDYLSTNGKAVA